MAKVIVLGLDGASWKVFNPLIKAGLFPHFGKILNLGVSAFLESTIPPITSPAWPSMVTGLNPGKLGVYSTSARSKARLFSLKPVTSSIYKGRSMWDFLSENEFRVALFKIPFLYPVYKVNGCMVSGFGSASKFAAYPRYLHQKLVNGPSSLLEAELFKSLQTLNPNNTESSVRFIEKLKLVVQEERKAILKLLPTLKWDFLFYVVSPLDWLQHAFMDKIFRLVRRFSSHTSLERNAIDSALIDFYKDIDILIGRFLDLVEQTDDDFAFFIVSDHGFTTRPYTFNIAKWLIENHYMKIRMHKKGHEAPLKSILVKKVSNLSKGAISGQILEEMLKILPSNILQELKNARMRAYLEASHKTSISAHVDFERSKIFCLEDRAIYVNSPFRDSKILDDMIVDLNKFLKRFPDVTLKAYRSKEVYWGDKVQLSPDLTISILDKDQIWEISTNPTRPLIFKPPLPGIHNRHGVFCAYGPQIKQRESLSNVLIWDICPTILHIFDVPIPSYIDGRVLKEIFLEDSEIAKRSIIYEEEIESQVEKEPE